MKPYRSRKSYKEMFKNKISKYNLKKKKKKKKETIQRTIDAIDNFNVHCFIEKQ